MYQINYKRFLTLQKDETDCGVACLLSIIRYYGGDSSLEILRQQSGTTITGTTMLGIIQAAQSQNLVAEPFEADDAATFIQGIPPPCILHVVIDKNLEHYVVYCGISPSGSGIMIMNPAKGMETWSETELQENWQSKALLSLTPTGQFVKVSHSNQQKIRWFQHLIQNDMPLLGLAIVTGILIAILGLSSAIFSQKLIDEILPKRQMSRLYIGIGLFSFILCLKAILSYLRGLFIIRQSKDFNTRLMSDFYEKLLFLPKIFFDTRKIGEIIARLGDTRRIQTVISFLVGNVVIDFLIFVISTGFIFSYSIIIGFISILALPVFTWLVWLYNHQIISKQKGVMAQYAMTESHFIDTISTLFNKLFDIFVF